MIVEESNAIDGMITLNIEFEEEDDALFADLMELSKITNRTLEDLIKEAILFGTASEVAEETTPDDI